MLVIFKNLISYTAKRYLVVLSIVQCHLSRQLNIMTYKPRYVMERFSETTALIKCIDLKVKRLVLCPVTKFDLFVSYVSFNRI